MNTDRLRQFCAVVESRTLTDAARALGMTPGALSRSLQRLGEEVGQRLFLPEGRTLRLSSEGRTFYPLARQVLEDIDRAIARLRERRDAVRALRVGTFEVFSSRVLVRILAAHLRDDEVLLRELTPGAMEDALLDRTIDYAVTYVPIPRPGLELHEVGSFRMVPCTGPGAFRKAPFDQIPFAIPITTVGPNALAVQSLDGWPQGVPRKVSQRFELLESALEACRTGLAAVHVPDFIMREQGFVALAAPKGYVAPRFQVFLVRRSDEVLDAPGKKLMRGLREMLRGGHSVEKPRSTRP